MQHWRRLILPFGSSIALATLVTHAAVVQGAEPMLGLWGAIIGYVLGIAYSTGRASFTVVGMVFGSTSGLQYFQCLPCDGSHLAMPILGAAVVGGLCWLAERQAMKQQRAS